MSDIYWVEIRGVRFDAAGDGGVGWVELTDWYGLPELRGELDFKPHWHGAFTRLDHWRVPRAVSLSALLHADARDDLERFRHEVSNRLAGAGWMRVADTTGVWERWVEVDKVQVFDKRAKDQVFELIVDVVAPDPVRYAADASEATARVSGTSSGLVLPRAFTWSFVESGSSTVHITNEGSVPVEPVVTVLGGFESMVLYDTSGNRRIGFGRIGVNDKLVVDCRERRILLNGVDATARAVSRDWFSVPPGESHSFVFLAEGRSGAPEAEFSWKIGVF